MKLPRYLSLFAAMMLLLTGCGETIPLVTSDAETPLQTTTTPETTEPIVTTTQIPPLHFDDAVTQTRGNGVMISGVPHYTQFEQWKTACETVATVSMLQYYGVDVDIDTFLREYLPTADYPCQGDDGELHGESPYEYFLGDPMKDNGYGCFNGAIAKGVNKLYDGLGVELNGLSLAQLCEDYVSHGEPVVIWATMNMAPTKKGMSWILPDGSRYVFVTPEHALVLVGYTDDSYILVDSLQWDDVTYYKKAQVETAYEAMEMRAVAVDTMALARMRMGLAPDTAQVNVAACGLIDPQDVLSESAQASLNQQIQAAAKASGMHVAVEINAAETPSYSDEAVAQLAGDRYDARFCGDGEEADGILLFLNMPTSYAYISTCGTGRLYYSNGECDSENRIQKMIDAMIPLLQAQSVEEAIQQFCADVKRYREAPVTKEMYLALCGVYDASRILADDDRTWLQKRVQVSAKATGLMLAVVLNEQDGTDEADMQAADDAYDRLFQMPEGKEMDGALLYLNLANNHVYISTSGMGMLYFFSGEKENRLDTMIDDMIPYLKQEDYRAAIQEFCSSVEKYYASGVPEKAYVYQAETGMYYYASDGKLVKSNELPAAYQE